MRPSRDQEATSKIKHLQRKTSVTKTQQHTYFKKEQRLTVPLHPPMVSSFLDLSHFFFFHRRSPWSQKYLSLRTCFASLATDESLSLPLTKTPVSSFSSFENKSGMTIETYRLSKAEPPSCDSRLWRRPAHLGRRGHPSSSGRTETFGTVLRSRLIVAI